MDDHAPVSDAPSKAAQRPQRVLIAFNHTDLSELAEAPEPSPEGIRELVALLSVEGFEVQAVNAEDDCDRLGDAVVLFRPDVVLNLIDHFHGNALFAASAAGLLDIFEFPYSGGDGHCIALCQDRLQGRLALVSAGIEVPRFVPVWARGPLPVLESLRFPAIFTQSFDDIYHRSSERLLLTDAATAREFATEVLLDYDPPLLFEEYVGHQKLSVIVVADEIALKPCEVWRDEEGEWQVAIADLADEQSDVISNIAIAASNVLGCRDLSMVEIAINTAGDVFVTDVRPTVTPWLPESPFRVAASEHPLGASGLLARVVNAALARGTRLEKLQGQAIAELSADAEAEAPYP